MTQEITYTITAKRFHITKTHRGGLKHRTTMAIFNIFGISDKKRPKMGLFFSYMPKRDLKLLVSPLSIRGMSL